MSELYVDIPVICHVGQPSQPDARPDPDALLLEQMARAATALECIATVLERWHNEYQIEQDHG